MSNQTLGIIVTCVVLPVCLFVAFAPASWVRKVLFDWRKK